MVDAERRRVLAVIPGIFYGKDPADTHAFIQVLDGTNHFSTYHRYPVRDFSASRTTLRLTVGPNRFEKDSIDLDIRSADRSIRGRLEFLSLTPWPSRLWSPGVMGVYAFVPFMECNHGVISLDHKIRGALSVDGRSIDFDGGRGYMEKDWGRSFPRDYVWIQANHFERAGASLMASVARIPWLGGAFRGFIIGLLVDGRLYRFATYTGASMRSLQVSEKTVEIDVCDRRHRLIIKARRTDTGLLHAPFSASMVSRITESLGSSVDVRLSKLGQRGFLFQGRGDPAGLDVHGKIENLMER